MTYAGVLGGFGGGDLPLVKGELNDFFLGEEFDDFEGEKGALKEFVFINILNYFICACINLR